MPVNYAKIGNPIGTPNPGGLVEEYHFYASKEDFNVIAEPSASPSAVADLVNITTNHTFKTGKCFREIYCTLDKGMVDSEEVGDLDGGMWRHVGKIFIPGVDATALGIFTQLRYDKGIWLFKTPDGKLLQVGNKMFGANHSGKFGTSQNAQGVRGTELTVTAMASAILYLYTGTVALTPAA